MAIIRIVKFETFLHVIYRKTKFLKNYYTATTATYLQGHIHRKKNNIWFYNKNKITHDQKFVNF